jgi:hypothetical protein
MVLRLSAATVTETMPTTAHASQGSKSKSDGQNIANDAGRRTDFNNQEEAHKDEIRNGKERALASDCNMRGLQRQRTRASGGSTSAASKNARAGWDQAENKQALAYSARTGTGIFRTAKSSQMLGEIDEGMGILHLPKEMSPTTFWLIWSL